MELNTLAKYKSWADDLLYNTLSGLPDRELLEDRKMLFGNIFSLLHHVYMMDIVWKSHLQGVPHNLKTRNPEVLSSFSELREIQALVNAWYENYFEYPDSEKYQETVNFEFIGGGAGAMTSAEIMHHAVNHASYHRGHIEGVLYQISIEPPTTDIPVFLKGRKA